MAVCAETELHGHRKGNKGGFPDVGSRRLCLVRPFTGESNHPLKQMCFGWSLPGLPVCCHRVALSKSLGQPAQRQKKDPGIALKTVSDSASDQDAKYTCALTLPDIVSFSERHGTRQDDVDLRKHVASKHISAHGVNLQGEGAVLHTNTRCLLVKFVQCSLSLGME